MQRLQNYQETKVTWVQIIDFLDHGRTSLMHPRDIIDPRAVRENPIGLFYTLDLT